MGHLYADKERWDSVAAALLRQAERGRAAGLDSEFYNVAIRTQSCVARSRLHLWSVAVNRWPLVLHPRGYYLADVAVLTADAIEHRGLREWLESDAPKVIHNLAVDAHTFANAGVPLGGAINTLARARFCWPERARGAGFDLDGLGNDVLALGKTEPGWVSKEAWRDGATAVFVRDRVEQILKLQKSERCSCGELKCRKRKGHERPVTEVMVEKRHYDVIPLEEMVPGHERWERAVAYAARDALVALYLNDRMDRMMQDRIPFPWLTDRTIGLQTVA